MKRNYAGIADKYAGYDDATVVLIPVPYDGTSTWQKGADKGPEAFLDASENMELYDIETNQLTYKVGVNLMPAVKANESPEIMTAEVFRRVNAEIEFGKFVTLFGGEHSISIGSLRAHMEHYSDLTVLHLDAHADLRPEYEESKCNHACALHESSKNANLIQVGIRSMDESELAYMNKDQTYFAHRIYNHDTWMDRSISQMTRNVYITVDLDVFDPSELPSTGTPEPGGLRYYQVLKYLRQVFRAVNVVGFDIVELKPVESDKSSDFLAAKLYYKMLSYKFDNGKL